MYALGLGAKQDRTEAKKWFREAAYHGNAEAQRDLGLLYHNWAAGQHDLIQSLAWLSTATANGDTRAPAIRDRLAEKMTPDQRAKAQKLAAEYIEKYNRDVARRQRPRPTNTNTTPSLD
jgi:TPR repeat protein